MGRLNTLQQYFEYFAGRYKCVENESIVLEIACNDGSQLNEFKKLGWLTVGVDPAENLREISSQRHNIYCDFWNSETAASIRTKYGLVDLIVAQNVFAHTDDIHGFLDNCKSVMGNDSILCIQVSQANMIESCQYDTIYHEHLSFFNEQSMKNILEQHNLYIQQHTIQDIHGGSHVFDISLLPSQYTPQVVYTLNDYMNYILKCKESSQKLSIQLLRPINLYSHVIGYGASAKGNTVLNYLGNKGSQFINFIVDDNPKKWGLYTPGTNIPIKSPQELIDEISTDKCLIVVMLTWNFATEIKRKLKEMGYTHIVYINTQ